jgi:hypothetical protein
MHKKCLKGVPTGTPFILPYDDLVLQANMGEGPETWQEFACSCSRF